MLYGGPKRINMPPALDPAAATIDVTNGASGKFGALA
jgi:hypothetical protein